MTFSEREPSRTQGAPINLYLFKGADPTIEAQARSVVMIPGATEFGYGTTPVFSEGQPITQYALQGRTDFQVAVDDLTSIGAGIDHVSLVVTWFGTDLRAANCEVRPKVETNVKATTPYEWNVGGLSRSEAQPVSYNDGRPAYGGAPSDRSVIEAITYLKSKGLKVTLLPLMMMDIPSGNSLPNPYGGASQPAYPWRGRVTCHPAIGQSGSVDKTSAAASQVASFFGACQANHFWWDPSLNHVRYDGPNEWSYRRFILHMATLGAVAGVDDFLIGSDMVGLTQVRSNASTFPAVNLLNGLAVSAREKLGPNVTISYAANWSEYHSYRPADGSGDVYFHLDPLWASANINYVGINNYLPLSDWRSGDVHLDRTLGWPSGHDRLYLQANIEGGEYYDWYYASPAHRASQERTPIADSAYGKPWVFRQKDIRSWWSSGHRNRPSGVESGSNTTWVAQSKPIRFVEFGIPAVNNATNQPSATFDPKSSESALPYFSNGVRDEAIQRAGIEAVLSYWDTRHGRNPVSSVYGGPMVMLHRTSLWCWDARPHPTFPQKANIWVDAPNWTTGHWLTGRLYGGQDFDAGPIGPFAYTNAETPITQGGITYVPWPIRRGALTSSGTLDKAMLEVTLAQGTEFGELYIAYPPAQVINLIIRQGHVGDDTSNMANYPVIWTGRVLGAQHPPSEVSFTCEPISTTIRRPGLRRNYQISCPHVLYGDSCRASRRRATRQVSVVGVEGTRVTLGNGWAGSFPPAKYAGGVFEWTKPDGRLEMRTILRHDGNMLLLSGIIRGLSPGATASVALGCGHDMADCRNLHDNIQNYGGQPFIPLKNPIGMVNVFY